MSRHCTLTRHSNAHALSLPCVCVCRSESKLQGSGEFPSVSLKREDSDNMDKHYWMTRANEVGHPHHPTCQRAVITPLPALPCPAPPAVIAAAAVHRVLVREGASALQSARGERENSLVTEQVEIFSIDIFFVLYTFIQQVCILITHYIIFTVNALKCKAHPPAVGGAGVAGRAAGQL